MKNKSEIALTVPLELFTAGTAKAIFSASKENKRMEDGFLRLKVDRAEGIVL
ncbi:hypothetical protein [Planococcus citreus]|uniref:hypothetical protein n=1 Tax=Planococcus citreus TaxID=1373 RepID=UPI0013050C5B|nr:hypothetical protein [Planococcus citreus]